MENPKDIDKRPDECYAMVSEVREMQKKKPFLTLHSFHRTTCNATPTIQ